MARRMSTVSTIIDAAVPGASILAGWLTYKASTRSARITAAAELRATEAAAAAERGNVEALAYQRATATLQGLIDSLQEEVDRWRVEADRLHAQLSTERQNNDILRAELRRAEGEAQRLGRELTELRTQLARLPADVAAQVNGVTQEGVRP